MAVTEADVRAWLAEDLGGGDLTSMALVPADARCTAAILLKEPGVVCGLAAVRAVLLELDADLVWKSQCHDGERAEPGGLVSVGGRARAILAGERLALNLLGRLSGIAALTRRFVNAVEGTDVTILDTRKTTPGLRALEKAAVRCGGGPNHRLGLYDGILIEDNHLRFAGGVGTTVARARGAGVPVEVECDTLDQVREALDAGADRILLDNMVPLQLAQAVALVDRRVALEVSGGVTLESVRAIAETGVDFISIGVLARARNAVILAHHYQVPEVQDVVDYVGDSLGLPRWAAATDAAAIVFCGVHFMAETAAILCPAKTVLIPDPDAGCSLAASIDADQLRAWKAKHPDAVVVSYVNTTAEVKAESDYCTTSGNARSVIEAIPKDREILFLPDLYLGLWLEKVTGRRLRIWMGECHVHAGIRPADIDRLTSDDPPAELLVHPECGCASQANPSIRPTSRLNKVVYCAMALPN